MASQLPIPPHTVQWPAGGANGRLTQQQSISTAVYQQRQGRQAGDPANYVRFNLPGIARLTQTGPIQVQDPQVLPALWLQQTENRIMHPIPPTRAPAGPPFTNQIDSSMRLTYRQLRPFWERDVEQSQDLRALWKRMSPSFRETMMEGVQAELPNKHVNIGTTALSKWLTLSNGNTSVPMKKYLALCMARYGTDVFDPTRSRRTMGAHQQEVQIQVQGRPLTVRLHRNRDSTFTYLPKIRKVSGFWDDEITLQGGGQRVNVHRDRSMIQHRTAHVFIGRPTRNEETITLSEGPLLTRLYEQLRDFQHTTLFNGDVQGQRSNHYCQLEIHVQFARHQEDYDGGSFIHGTLRSTWHKELGGPANDPYRPLIQNLQDAILAQIQSIKDNFNETDNSLRVQNRHPDHVNGYALYLHATWIRNDIDGMPRVLRASTRRQRRRGGAHICGTNEERLFTKGSMLPRFMYERALFWCPPRPHQTCVLMSLFRATRTCYHFTDQVVTKLSTPANKFAVDQDELLFPVIDTDFWTQLTDSQQAQLPFLVPTTEEVGYFAFRLSCGYKHKLREDEVDELLDTEDENVYFRQPHHPPTAPYHKGCKSQWEEEMWEKASEEMFAWLEVTCQRDIDQNELGDCIQAFADVFGICVSVHDIECRGQRIEVYTPHQQSVQALIPTEGTAILHMIHIVYDQGHLHPISHFPSFIASKKLKGRDRYGPTHQYCPICDSHKQFKSFQEASSHWTQCVKRQKQFTLRETGVIHSRFTSATTPVEKKFRPKEFTPYYQCKGCKQEIATATSLFHHVCKLPVRPKDPLPNQKIYAYDLESAQIRNPETDVLLLEHVCNKVCVKEVYGDQAFTFENEMDFVKHILQDPQFHEAVFLAHNGGSYDSQFILRVLERWEIDFHFVPSPGSDHKFLLLELKESKIRFMDFMRFVPGSLKNVAKSFGCELAKGDFPHKFNNGEHDSYRGPLPPHHPDEEDYWCQHHVRSEKEQQAFEKWYSQEACQEYCTCWNTPTCECNKRPWDFQEEIVKYCQLDVQVLAEAIRKYRDGVMQLDPGGPCPDSEIDWRPPQLDPFNYVTIAQLALNTFSQGFQNPDDSLSVLHQPTRAGLNPKAIAWLDRLNQEQPHQRILHRGNHHREFFHFQSNLFFDGYCEETNTLYLFMDCKYWGCDECLQGDETVIHPTQKIPYASIQEQFEFALSRIESTYRFKIIWEHEFDSTYQQLSPYEKECSSLFSFQEAFYGGRTEVFSPYANAQVLNKEIKDIDVTSLYPSVYLAKLPVGIPVHLRGSIEIDPQRLHPSHPNRYFGFVKCHVTPNPKDIIGLLPQHDPETKRLCFPVHPMVGVWGTEELYLAIEQGYIVNTIYELYHWDQLQSSDQHLRGYVSYFLRMKQEAEGWKKLSGGEFGHTPTEEQQAIIIQRLYEQNGYLARIRPEYVEVNPVKRQLAKLYLNSLWGKFAQQTSYRQFKTIYSPEQFATLWSDPLLVRDKFQVRESAPGIFKCSYDIQTPYTVPVAHENVLFAAMVTMHARCVLHKRILLIGPERALYVDTDSLKFLMDKDDRIENYTGVGLGKWTDEYPDEVIEEFGALAPKMYTLAFKDKQEESVRGKGVILSLRNQRRLRLEHLKTIMLPIVQGQPPSPEYTLSLENFSIFANCTKHQLEYGTMLTRENEKSVRMTISKRTIVTDPDFAFSQGRIHTLPKGYQA